MGEGKLHHGVVFQCGGTPTSDLGLFGAECNFFINEGFKWHFEQKPQVHQGPKGRPSCCQGAFLPPIVLNTMQEHAVVQPVLAFQALTKMMARYQQLCICAAVSSPIRTVGLHPQRCEIQPRWSFTKKGRGTQIPWPMTPGLANKGVAADCNSTDWPWFTADFPS